MINLTHKLTNKVEKEVFMFLSYVIDYPSKLLEKLFKLLLTADF
jgi:hypothetical protein